MRIPIRLRLVVVTLVCFGCALSASTACAAEFAPQWTVTSVSGPTNFAPGGTSAAYHVTLTNTGGASSEGPVQVTDELSQGLSLDSAGASGEVDQGGRLSFGPSPDLSCVLRTCTYTGVVMPGQSILLTFPVDVTAGALVSTCEVPAGAVGCLTSVVRVSGGGAPVNSVSTPTVISDQAAAFGISPGGASTSLSSLQAGAHPDITNTIAFNTVNAQGGLAGDPKDVTFDLPPGFAGDLVDTPSCPSATFLQEECSPGTQIGVTTLSLTGGKVNNNGKTSESGVEPVYNLSANPGEIAKLGFVVAGAVHVEGGITVRPGDYGLRVTFQDLNQVVLELDNVSLTVWGVPADPLHDPLRWQHEGKGTGIGSFGGPSGVVPAPFFTNPTSCGAGPLDSEFHVDSWEQPEVSVAERMPFGPVVGCDRLGMEPSLTVEATTSNAYAPSGLNLGLGIPQTYENPAGLATSSLESAVLTLPEGMTVNPSAGAGLGVCTQAEYEEEPEQAVPGLGCPSESKLGTVKIVTPALKEEVAGSVYLAQPYANPFRSTEHPTGSLLALYIVARIPDRGVLIRAAGEVSADPVTGRLVTTFNDLPPLPFSLFTFRFNQGATSPLVTPPACGDYTVQAALTPWSNLSGAPLVPLIPPFPIDSNCPSGGVPPFAPQVIAGTGDNNAGSYSSLYLRVVRNDGEQEITGFSSQLPPGLTANLSGVPFCSEAQIALARTKTGAEEEANPACPVASEIGHTLVGAGVGSVLAYAPGKVYLAGPFQGAPFSIAAITSAKVGPFDLGTVVVHLPLDLNPETAAVSIPAGAADQIPHIIRGIVVHVRDIRVYIDRHDFTLDPTNCNPMSFGVSVIGGGADPTNPADNDPVSVNSPFQAADCQSLKFAPKFQVSTSGRTSRANGASLSVKLTYPAGSLGQDANVRQVKVELPKQLPSRLSTLQKACTAAQFKANPAGCPAASIVGHAKAITPLIPVPLEGPAYFVSNGGEAFPNLIVVLQGYGIMIDLVGDTFISNKGITSSTFKTVPDQPIGSFQLTLPEGEFSALAANGNICKSKLSLPTEFVAQNGDTIHQKTRITVTGCPKAGNVKKSKTDKRGKRKQHQKK